MWRLAQIRNGPKFKSRASRQEDPAASRRKVLQWFLTYANIRGFDSAAKEALFDESGVDGAAAVGTKKESMGAEAVAAWNMDRRIFRQALDVLCFRVLKVWASSLCACMTLLLCCAVLHCSNYIFIAMLCFAYLSTGLFVNIHENRVFATSLFDKKTAMLLLRSSSGKELLRPVELKLQHQAVAAAAVTAVEVVVVVVVVVAVLVVVGTSRASAPSSAT
jgi:hypothetical protein